MDFREILNALKEEELRKIAVLAKIEDAISLNKEQLIQELYLYELNQDSNSVRFAELVKQL